MTSLSEAEAILSFNPDGTCRSCDNDYDDEVGWPDRNVAENTETNLGRDNEDEGD
jgi:hypothetical protein